MCYLLSLPRDFYICFSNTVQNFKILSCFFCMRFSFRCTHFKTRLNFVTNDIAITENSEIFSMFIWYLMHIEINMVVDWLRWATSSVEHCLCDHQTNSCIFYLPSAHQNDVSKLRSFYSMLCGLYLKLFRNVFDNKNKGIFFVGELNAWKTQHWTKHEDNEMRSSFKIIMV